MFLPSIGSGVDWAFHRITGHHIRLIPENPEFYDIHEMPIGHYIRRIPKEELFARMYSVCGAVEGVALVFFAPFISCAWNSDYCMRPGSADGFFLFIGTGIGMGVGSVAGYVKGLRIGCGALLDNPCRDIIDGTVTGLGVGLGVVSVATSFGARVDTLPFLQGSLKFTAACGGVGAVVGVAATCVRGIGNGIIRCLTGRCSSIRPHQA